VLLDDRIQAFLCRQPGGPVRRVHAKDRFGPTLAEGPISLRDAEAMLREWIDAMPEGSR